MEQLISVFDPSFKAAAISKLPILVRFTFSGSGGGKSYFLVKNESDYDILVLNLTPRTRISVYSTYFTTYTKLTDLINHLYEMYPKIDQLVGIEYNGIINLEYIDCLDSLIELFKINGSIVYLVSQIDYSKHIISGIVVI